MRTANVTTRQGSAAAMMPFYAARDYVRTARPGQENDGDERCLSFGPYRLFPRQRLLLNAGKPVQLGDKALDILILLAERMGHVVSKRELMTLAWPGVAVEEGALRVHVASLRKVLGDDDACHIRTDAGRGYCLVAAAARAEVASESRTQAGPLQDHAPGLRLPLERLVGRTEDARKISDLLLAKRFVTIFGSGGVGKTTIAAAIGHAQTASFAGAVHLLDLGRISEPERLPSALAALFGLSVQSNDPTADVLAFLRDRRMLLIFDSCEHLIEQAAVLIERVFHAAPQVAILATSREMLRVDGEHVYRLSGLACPLDEGVQSTERVMEFAAPRLFVNRVAASGCQLDLTDADAPIVARICRGMDGLALAINLAAEHAGTFGLSGIADSLETRCWLLWRGRRTALPRHQTIAAMIDWSYGLLSQAEQAALRRLSIFNGRFSLDAACGIACHGLPDGAGDLLVIDKLVAKSLLLFESANGVAGYRLLNSTRAYALEKLRNGGEFEAIAQKARQWAAIEAMARAETAGRIPARSGLLMRATMPLVA